MGLAVKNQRGRVALGLVQTRRRIGSGRSFARGLPNRFARFRIYCRDEAGAILLVSKDDFVVNDHGGSPATVLAHERSEVARPNGLPSMVERRQRVARWFVPGDINAILIHRWRGRRKAVELVPGKR